MRRRASGWPHGRMSEPTLYLFDGYNVLHAGEFGGDVRELKDILASFVAVRGARGIVVFDGVGRDETLGPLEVRCTAGQQVGQLSSRTFVRDLEAPEHSESRPAQLADRLDPEVREQLERLRRGEH